jgi:hypothetical protein
MNLGGIMNRIVAGIAGVATVIALGAFFAAPAGAHLFLFTGTLPALLLLLGAGPQVFLPEEGGIEVVCNAARLHGRGPSKAMQASTILVKGIYEKCTAAGLEANVSEVEYELSAEETLLNVRHITVTIPAFECTILFLRQNNITVRYLRLPTDVEAHLSGTNVHRIVTGGGDFCGLQGLRIAGIYRGLFLLRTDGGTVQWD